MDSSQRFDYLTIGHIACDLTPTGEVTGGTVAYSGATARALGCHTAMLTSAAPDFDFEQDEALTGIVIERLPASQTTTFKNVYSQDGRTQYLYGRARPLSCHHVPRGWKHTPIVHLAPIAAELDPALVYDFGNSLIGLTPQGWMRTWDAEGRVHQQFWEQAQDVMPLAAAVVLSDEDLTDRAWLDHFRQWAPLLVLTHGANGCTVFMGDEERSFPAPEVEEVNPTGAGDVFAAAFFIRLYQTKGNPWEAARFANKIAAQSVMGSDLASKIRCVENTL